MARRFAALLFTMVAAIALAHVFFATTIEDANLVSTIGELPAGLTDRFVHGDFGATEGGGCNQRDDYHPLCSSYGATTIARMLRARVPIDVSLLLGGVLIGSLAGLAGGRWCATRPYSRRTKGLHAI